MEELINEIDRIGKDVKEVARKLALIDEIFENFSDASEWDTAREENKNNKSEEVWGKRKLYLHFTFQQLAEERDHLRTKEKYLREEKSILLRKEIQLKNETMDTENGLT